MLLDRKCKIDIEPGIFMKDIFTETCTFDEICISKMHQPYQSDIT